MHSPLPEHGPDADVEGHVDRSHAKPEKPSAHSHDPVSRSQVPMLEHSTSAWATLVAVAWSNQAMPFGHTLSEQSAVAFHWPSQVHTAMSSSPYPHVPWPLQAFAHAALAGRMQSGVVVAATHVNHATRYNLMPKTGLFVVFSGQRLSDVPAWRQAEWNDT
jgi:hypothetical protein